MKCFCLLLTLLFFCINSHAQQRVRSMSDGVRRIYYTELSEAKTKLMEYYKERKNNDESDFEYSLEHFPFDMFKDLVLHDERSLCYDFAFNEIDEITSDDKTIKIYSWNTGQGGAIRNFQYDGVFTYISNEQYYAFSPVYEDEYREDVVNDGYSNIVPLWLSPSSLHVVAKDSRSVKFIIDFSYRTYGYYQTLCAYSITDGKLSSESIFEMEDGKCVSEIEHSFLSGWSEFPSYISCDSHTILRPIMYQPEETIGYCLPYSSGRTQQWKFDGLKYKYHGIAYVGDEVVHSKLRNYSANVVTLHMGPWIIRIDLMPNGAYRYSSWKNKDISQEPNIVINSGYRTTPVEGDEGFISFKNEYVFQNNEYFYIVSYEMVVYNGMYECSSPQVIVKKNDKVLLTIASHQ